MNPLYNQIKSIKGKMLRNLENFNQEFYINLYNPFIFFFKNHFPFSMLGWLVIGIIAATLCEGRTFRLSVQLSLKYL